MPPKHCLLKSFAKEQIWFCRYNKTEPDWTDPAHLICLSLLGSWKLERKFIYMQTYTWCCQCWMVHPGFRSCSVMGRVGKSCSLCISPLCNSSGASQCAWSLLETLLQRVHQLTPPSFLVASFTPVVLCFRGPAFCQVWLFLATGFKCYYKGLTGSTIAQVSAPEETRIKIPQGEQKGEKITLKNLETFKHSSAKARVEQGFSRQCSSS